MSDPGHAQASPGENEPEARPPEEAPQGPARPSPARAEGIAWRPVAVGLGIVLLLIVALVATAPLWAPLLPWGSAAAREDRQLAARLDRLEAAQSKTQQLVEQRQQEQTPARQQAQQAAAETKSALERLGERVGQIEARAAAPSGIITDIRQVLTKLSQSAAELASRVDALEKTGQTRSTRDAADVGLVIALLQIRAALDTGRPFAAEYEAFAALARGRPEIAAAAEPLAEPARNGVATRAVLAKRLKELAGGIASGGGPGDADRSDGKAAPGWLDEALARLRSLVRIRHIGGARPGGAAAVVNSAELALAGGDLAGAVDALEKLSGAPAEAAAPWLGMARQRLAVEAALGRIEALATAQLGNPPAAPGSPG